MKFKPSLLLLAVVLLIPPGIRPLIAQSPAIAGLVTAVNQTGEGGAGHGRAIEAMRGWLADPTPADEKIVVTLNAFSTANERGKNWLRLAAGSLRSGMDEALLAATLKSYIDNRDNDSTARYWAYRQWSGLPSTTDDMRNAVLDAGCDDPSISLRFLAVQKAIHDADAIFKNDNDSRDAIESLAATLPLARHADQLREISSRLTDRGVKVNLSQELAMLDRWWTIGPFPNTDSKHFGTAYPPEQLYLAAPMAGVTADAPIQAGDKTVSWKTVSTDEAMGLVDLNAPYENAKDSIVYAFAIIEIDENDLRGPDGSAHTFQARLGSINANKVWVNGTPVASNEIYHSGSSIDQYVAECPLKVGMNSVLLKMCQNNQTQAWAQEFEFRFRLTDSTGRGITHQTIVPESSTPENQE